MPGRSGSEGVEKLVEEGNAFESSIVDGVENAKDQDVSEVTTRQVPEDDVPEDSALDVILTTRLPLRWNAAKDDTCDKHIQTDRENHHVTERHERAAELHNLAAHAHAAAAVAHGKEDHLTAHELSKQAHEHSMNVHKLTQELSRETVQFQSAEVPTQKAR